MRVAGVDGGRRGRNDRCCGRVGCGLRIMSVVVHKSSTESTALTYLPMIFFKACGRIDQGNTFTSFSIFRGFGLGNDMISLKKFSLSALAFDTVSGLNPSKFLRIRFFSSTVNRTAINDSSNEMQSTLVM